jgi:hypothetical protein
MRGETSWGMSVQWLPFSSFTRRLSGRILYGSPIEEGAGLSRNLPKLFEEVYVVTCLSIIQGMKMRLACCLISIAFCAAFIVSPVAAVEGINAGTSEPISNSITLDPAEDRSNSGATAEDQGIRTTSWRLVGNSTVSLDGIGDVKTSPRLRIRQSGRMKFVMTGPLSTDFDMYVLYKGRKYSNWSYGSYEVVEKRMGKGTSCRVQIRSSGGSGEAIVEAYHKG